ncbi:putative ras [Cladorrhinum samala]|uniref:Ras n=1 Tax=Cladorrhinum samala TaxID=585594 RepID=A0AAV9HEE6_9PEZI|nr:putative ras [Cladorrhinum samala]
MSAQNLSAVRTLYRNLLKELPPRALLKAPRAPLHQLLRKEFTSSKLESNAPKLNQYLAYLKSQRQYVELIERYNPGMGMDEEERVRLTARRVGMNLPKEFQDGKQ